MDRNFLCRRRSLLIVLFLFSFPLCGAAKEPRPEQSWDNLKQLKPGTRIQVQDMNLKSVKGEFLGVTDETLSFSTSKGEKSLDRADVYQVRNRDKNKHVRNGLIGMGIGAALLGAAFASCESCGQGAASGGVLGGAIWGTIGFAFGSHQIVYKAEKIETRKKPR